MSFEILKRFVGAQQGKHAQHQQAQLYELVRLHIRQAKRSHSGEFVCHAANQFGSDEKLIKLLVQEPPDPVREISARQVDSRSISIAWQPPYNGNSPIVSYTVEWAPISTGPEQAIDTEAASANTIETPGQQVGGRASHEAARWSHAVAQQPALTIGSLQPLTSYEIRVSAHNQLGRSSMAQQHSQSARFVVTTSEEAPSTPPADIRATPMSSTSLQVTWLPHTHVYATSGQGSPSKESLSTSTSGGGGETANRQQPLYLDSKQDEAVRRQLLSIKGYYLGYKVANTNDSYMFRTVPLYGGAAGAPTSTGQQQQQVHFGRAHHQPYQVDPSHDLVLSANLYGSTGGRPGDTHLAPPLYRPAPRQAADFNTSAAAQSTSSEQPHRLRVLIGDLKRSTKYSIIVQAYNSAGPGPQSDPVEARTLLNDPPPAPALRVGLTSHTSIELQWSFQVTDSGGAQLAGGLADQVQQVNLIPNGHDELVPESLDSIKQMARFSTSALPSSSLGGQLVGATTSTQSPPGEPQPQAAAESQQAASQQQPPIIDGYHLYYRQADSDSNGAWMERRLSPESHSIVATGSGGNHLVRSSEQLHSSADPASQQDMAEHSAILGPSKPGGESAGAGKSGANKQRQAAPLNLSWLKFYGANASLSHKSFHYVLDELACGQLYQIYLVAYNSYGSGLPSQIIRAKTRGSAPLAPDKQKDFIQANSTLVRLNLFAWHDSGCSLANFEIKYKQLSGRHEAISMLSSAANAASNTDSQYQHQGDLGVPGAGVKKPAQATSGGASSGWLMLSNNISPEQGSIEVRDLRPETWYGLWVVAESSAGKTEAQYAFMTLDRLGQVPADAIEPLPVPTGGANQPALFRSGSSAGSSTIRSLLFNLSGSGIASGGSNSLLVVSPLIVSTCMCLVVFATCSLFLIRRYNNMLKESYDSSPAEATSMQCNTSANAGDRLGGGATLSVPLGGHKFNGSSSDSSSPMPAHLDSDEHAHHFHHQAKFHRLTGNDGYGVSSHSSPPPPTSFGQQQQQQEYFSMRVSPCKKGTTIITNSSSSTNGSSALLLNGSSSSGGGGGIGGDPGSSICDSATIAAYGSITSAAHDQAAGHHHQLQARLAAGSGDFLQQAGDSGAGEQQSEAQVFSMAQLNQMLAAGGNSSGAPHQQQICSQQNCPANGLNGGKFATLARGAAGQDLEHHHNNLGADGGLCQLMGSAAQLSAFKTLPHQAVRPLSTFLPPNSSQYHQQNRFVCAPGSGQPGASDYQQHQQQLAEQQQIYSKLRLLQHYDAAAMAAAGNYNLTVCHQQQQQQQQETAAASGQGRMLVQDEALALNQMYEGHNSGSNANPDSTSTMSDVTNLVQAQSHDLATNSQQQAQKTNHQQASNSSEQDDYALPFPPRWV